MVRILFCGDSPTVDTGFGVVARNILGRLHEKQYELAVMGVNHFGDPYDQRVYPYPIFGGDRGSMEMIYGYRKFWEIEEKFKPDLIFFLNDPWVIDRYLVHKPENHNRSVKMMAYFPIDAGPLKPEWAEMLNRMDAQVCYSLFGESVVTQANKNKRPKNLYQIYHGVDTTKFFPVNQAEARTKLGLPLDAFIVGMVARNQYRKRFDILIKAFSEFAKDKPNAKLYLHTGLHDVGFDIMDLSRQFNLRDRLILTEDMDVSQGVPTHVLNLIYNSFDVNALISLGDGFGLPVAESMAVGCPQLVSDHSCLKELVEGSNGGVTVKTDAWLLNASGINTWGGLSSPEDITDKLNFLYNNQDIRRQMGEQAFYYITQDKFNWDYITDQFDAVIKKIFHIIKIERRDFVGNSETHIREASPVSVG